MSTRIRWTASVMGSPGGVATVVARSFGIGSLLQDQARSTHGNGPGGGVVRQGCGDVGWRLKDRFDGLGRTAVHTPTDRVAEIAGLERLADESVGAGVQRLVLEVGRPADGED